MIVFMELTVKESFSWLKTKILKSCFNIITSRIIVIWYKLCWIGKCVSIYSKPEDTDQIQDLPTIARYINSTIGEIGPDVQVHIINTLKERYTM